LQLADNRDHGLDAGRKHPVEARPIGECRVGGISLGVYAPVGSPCQAESDLQDHIGERAAPYCTLICGLERCGAMPPGVAHRRLDEDLDLLGSQIDSEAVIPRALRSPPPAASDHAG
jgi:hypothetical protein